MNKKIYVSLATVALLSSLGMINHKTHADTNQYQPHISDVQDIKNFQITNISYDSIKGILKGDVPEGVTSYKVQVDGIDFDETFTVEGNQFVSTVSNEFYHTVKTGYHVVKIMGLNDQQEVIASGIIDSNDFDNEQVGEQITNISYDSIKGILKGDVPEGVTSYKVQVDGIDFDETFTVEGNQFVSNVSDEFYHAVKTGYHVVKIMGLNDQQEVIASGIIDSDDFDNN